MRGHLREDAATAGIRKDIHKQSCDHMPVTVARSATLSLLLPAYTAAMHINIWRTAQRKNYNY